MNYLERQALEDMRFLVEQGKSVKEAASHAFHRFGIPKADLIKLWEANKNEDKS